MAIDCGGEVARAASILRQGGLVAFATETVYGLGADALNPKAVARVFAVKRRPEFDPLIVHVASLAWLPRLTQAVIPAARKLMDAFWPGPLSIVLPKADCVPDLVTAGLPDVAIRIPDHPLAQALLSAADRPLAAPSANLFGRVSPTRAEHVAEQFQTGIDYILDGGACRVGVESTVVRFLADRTGSWQCELLRPGGVTIEQLRQVIGPVSVAEDTAHPVLQAQSAPGRLPRHYAPRTPVRIVSGPTLPGESGRVGFLSRGPLADSSGFAAIEVLSQTGDLSECAVGFFAALRRLDSADLDLILAESFPERELGRALNDRLRRAANAAVV